MLLFPSHALWQTELQPLTALHKLPSNLELYLADLMLVASLPSHFSLRGFLLLLLPILILIPVLLQEGSGSTRSVCDLHLIVLLGLLRVVLEAAVLEERFWEELVAVGFALWRGVGHCGRWRWHSRSWFTTNLQLIRLQRLFQLELALLNQPQHYRIADLLVFGWVQLAILKREKPAL